MLQTRMEIFCNAAPTPNSNTHTDCNCHCDADPNSDSYFNASDSSNCPNESNRS